MHCCGYTDSVVSTAKINAICACGYLLTFDICDPKPDLCTLNTPVHITVSFSFILQDISNL